MVGDVMKKNKNKIINFILILLIIFITVLSFNNMVFATDVISNPDKFKPGSSGSEQELTQRAGVILGVVNTVGIVVSVLTLMILGVKYILGSVEEKAEYKKTMGMYLLGAFLVMSITTIPNVLYKIASNI